MKYSNNDVFFFLSIANAQIFGPLLKDFNRTGGQEKHKDITEHRKIIKRINAMVDHDYIEQYTNYIFIFCETLMYRR